MKQLRLAAFLLRPSIFSFTVTFVLALFVLSIANWSYVLQSPLFYDYFFGEYGLATRLQQSPDSLSAFTSTLFAKSLSYNVAVFVLAILAGLTIFITLHIGSKFIASISTTWANIHYAEGRSKAAVEKEIGIRLGFRAGILLLWAIYLLLFLKIILPFCILNSRIGVNELTQTSGWLYSLLGFGVLFVALHLHVIFLRLVLLRPRVFGLGTLPQ